MKESTLFDEAKPVYKVINHAFRNIKDEGFYKAIFTDEYFALDEDDQNMVIGVIQGDYGLTIYDLINNCIEEKE